MGPDEDHREGWISHDNTENADLTWTLPLEPEVALGKTWRWEWVYKQEVEAMLPILSKIASDNVDRTMGSEGLTVIRADPANAGVILAWAENRALSGLHGERQPVGPTTPIGIRCYPNTTTPSPPAYTIDDPLVLFLSDLYNPNETFITLTSHLNSSVLPLIISVLQQIPAETPNATRSIRAFGLERSDVLVVELLKRGATYQSRIETRYMPCGVAWYGRKGTAARMDGLELWACV